LKFFFDKVFNVNVIWASAIDTASRFILFETAEADEDDVWLGMIKVLVLFDKNSWNL
jgi:hypothetical protein